MQSRIEMKTFIQTLFIFFLFSILYISCVKEVEKIVEVPVYKSPVDSSGCTSNDSITICYTKTSPCTLGGEEFNFTVSGKATEKDVEKYEWYFGDGDNRIATNKTVTKTYAEAGMKSVLLKVKKYGDYLEKRINVLADGQSAIPEPKIAGINSVSIVGKTATYRFQGNVQQSTSSYTYTWNFGDGKLGYEQYLDHTFDLKPAEQTLKITLTVTSKAGCQRSLSQYITIPAYYDITDSIKYSVAGVCDNNEEFTFTAPSANIPANAQYSWDFKDGTTANTKVAKHKFTNKGLYAVNLKIIYNNNDIYLNSITVFAKGQDAKPPAAFSLQGPYHFTTQTKCFFNNIYSGNAGGNIINWQWDLGDGSPIINGKQTGVEKYYDRQTVDKNYKVIMIVTAESGCINKDSTVIFIPRL